MRAPSASASLRPPRTRKRAASCKTTLLCRKASCALSSFPSASPSSAPLKLMPKRVLLSWSSGKDSAWSLHILRQDPEIEVVGLLTTVNEAFDRVAMHAVRRDLLLRQAEAA